MALAQGARAVVWVWLFTLARRGAIGGTSGSRPPRSPCFPILPEVTIRGWRWGTWWEMSQGTRETMIGAHLGGRGACRRRSSTKIAPPRRVCRRGIHGGGRHLPCKPNAKLAPISVTKPYSEIVTNMWSWTRPTVSKAAQPALLPGVEGAHGGRKRPSPSAGSPLRRGGRFGWPGAQSGVWPTSSVVLERLSLRGGDLEGALGTRLLRLRLPSAPPLCT